MEHALIDRFILNLSISYRNIGIGGGFKFYYSYLC